MKKIGRDKLVEAQIEALCKAYTWVKEYGYEEGLKKIDDEVHYRNVTYIPLSYSKEKIEGYLKEMTENILNTTLLLSLTVLRDEFGFGKDRAERFWKRYTLKTACLMDRAISELSWEDLAQQAKEELGYDTTLNWDAWKNIK